MKRVKRKFLIGVFSFFMASRAFALAYQIIGANILFRQGKGEFLSGSVEGLGEKKFRWPAENIKILLRGHTIIFQNTQRKENQVTLPFPNISSDPGHILRMSDLNARFVPGREMSIKLRKAYVMSSNSQNYGVAHFFLQCQKNQSGLKAMNFLSLCLNGQTQMNISGIDWSPEWKRKLKEANVLLSHQKQEDRYFTSFCKN